MIQFKHPLCTDSLAPGVGDAGKVDALWIQRGLFQGHPCVRSFWRPTPAELRCLAAGGPAVLTLLGHTHAPLRIDAIAPDEGEQATPGSLHYRHDPELLHALYLDLGARLADWAANGRPDGLEGLTPEQASERAFTDMAKLYADTLLRRHV